MKITAFGSTDVGKVRENNEDNLLILDISQYVGTNSLEAVDTKEGIVLLVADGMGGAVAGETASLTVVNTAENFFLTRKDLNSEDLVSKYAFDAHEECFRLIRQNPELEGMGSVATCAYIKGNEVFISHVGDTRFYIYRSKTLTQITEDQNFVNELVKLGAITPEQALYHPQRNAVTQAIGALDELVPILYKTDLMQDDIILLCSDGLTNMLSDVELQVAIESYKNMEALVDGLIGMANNHGGYDNITVIAAKIY